MLEKMKEIELRPTAVTYNRLMCIAIKGIWRWLLAIDEMVTEGIRPTVSTYNMSIHALFLDGKMNEADGIIKVMKD